MLKPRLYGFWVMVFLLLSFCVPAQVKVSVVPSKTVVELNEPFQIEFMIEGTSKVDQVIIPSFRNFEQIGEMTQTIGYTWSNSSLAEYTSYKITLRPLIKGRLTIASAIVKANGTIATSPTLAISVNAAVVTEKKEEMDGYLDRNENVREKIIKNIFVKATIDKHSCYLGEPLLVTFKLFTRLNSESKVVKRPSLNGFSVLDLEGPESGIFSKELYEGKIYDCYLLRKAQIFPMQTGSLTIEPIELENIVRFKVRKPLMNKNISTWLDAVKEKMKEAEISSGDMVEEKIILKSDSLKVNVLDLPEKNKPESFDGAVGNFSMQVSLLNKSIAANDYATLRVVIKGIGNLPMITAPTVHWPSGVDSFDAKLSEEIDKHNAPISGTKTFDIPFAVSKAGLFTIPRINFTYFDEQTKTYHTLSSDSMELNVTAAVKRKTPVFNDEPIVKEGSPGWVLVATVGCGLLVLIAGIFFVQHKREKKAEQKNIVPQQVVEDIQLQKTMGAYLQPAAYVLQGLHPKQFYTLLIQGLHDFLIERLDLQAKTISNIQLVKALQQRNWPDLAAQFQQLAEACELAVFSPLELTDNREQLMQQSKQLMQEVDERIKIA